MPSIPEDAACTIPKIYVQSPVVDIAEISRNLRLRVKRRKSLSCQTSKIFQGYTTNYSSVPNVVGTSVNQKLMVYPHNVNGPL